MRHRKNHYALNRFTSWRKATLKSLARNLLKEQSIKTTQAKAKAVRPLVERLISLSKANTLAAKRQAYALLGEHKLVSILFDQIGPRFINRTGGYTRILGLGARRGDNAQMVILALSEIKKKEPKKHKKGAPKATEAKTPGEAALEKAHPTEEKLKNQTQVMEKPPATKKPSKNFLGGLRSIFKKERDSL